ncbi:MAG: IMP dehydrogenase [Patescibacteria group bacterium]|nr:IMP dehydrogenase [Patescibacteria group bacterium]
MSKKIISQALTFDDVSLKPGISRVPAHEVSTKTNLTKKIQLKIPLISAAMDTVTESNMAVEMAKLGGLGIIHRNLSPKEQVREVKKVKAKKLLVGAAIGTSGDFLKRTRMLVQAGVDVVSIDLAHGSTRWAKEAIEKIKKQFENIELIAGNVASYEGARFLARAGADAIKVGLGGGSICTTRLITGVGVPNITAIFEVQRALSGSDIPIIIDGGIRYSGDLIKAIAAGASCGMCGSLLAGTLETPGKIKERNGRRFKLYRGMSVKEAMNHRTQDRYYLKKENKAHTSQGVSGFIPYKGKVKRIIEVFTGGVRAGLENVGAKNFKELQEKAEFYQVSNAGSREGHAHDIQIIKNEINYSRTP